MTIQELREKRSKAWDTARDFLDSKRNESGLLSEEDSKTYDAMEQQIVAYGKEIQRLERQAQIEAEMNKPTSTPIQNKPNASTHSDTKTGIASDEYCTAFWRTHISCRMILLDRLPSVRTRSARQLRSLRNC